MKKRGLIFLVIVVLSVGTFSIAEGDTILFPVLASNPSGGVTTLISVANYSVVGTPSTHLKYFYASKEALIGGLPNHTGDCNSTFQVRPTYPFDLVTFDVSGSFGGGGALFSDPNSYGGNFDIQRSGALRGYLLVTNSDAAGNAVSVGTNYPALYGEAINIDFLEGAAWGYRAINDNTTENNDFTHVSAGGGVTTALTAGTSDNSYRMFTFFPTNIFTTKFFVTPIRTSMHLFTGNATVKLMQAASFATGLYDRGGNVHLFSNTQQVQCTAAIGITELMDATALAAVQNTGGWAWFNNISGNAVVVYKLEFNVDASTYNGTLNNGYLLSTDQIP